MESLCSNIYNHLPSIKASMLPKLHECHKNTNTSKYYTFTIFLYYILCKNYFISLINLKRVLEGNK